MNTLGSEWTQSINMVNCFVCGESTSEENEVTVKERGIKTLLSASIVRGDNEHQQMLESVDSVTLHVACRLRYIDTRCVGAPRRRRDSVAPSTSSAVESQAPPTFDFKSHCFICAERIPSLSEEMRLHVRKRKPVRTVTRNSIRNTILNWCNSRTDDFASEIVARIQNVSDFVAVGARYHASCVRKVNRGCSKDRAGRPVSNEVNSAMADIYDYIEENSDECQFTFKELQECIKGDFVPYPTTIKQRLQEEYGHEILIFEKQGTPCIICFRNTGYKILSKAWYDAKNSDPEEERLRVIREAAAIIVEDIRSKLYDTKSYPPSDNFMDNVDDSIPASLNVLLSEIICKTKKGSLESWKRKCTSIAHAIISAVRPRSFISSLQIGVGAFLYKKFGSRLLIDVLSSLGFSSSYENVSSYEATSITRPQRQVKDTDFIQFVYDNADFNINTLDGHDTFHCMGGIQCVTPFDAIEPDTEMTRSSVRKSAAAIAQIGHEEMRYYGKEKLAGFRKVQVAKIATAGTISKTCLPTIGDFMWLYGKWACVAGIPGWNGFMEEVTVNKSFVRSKVMFLPFINGSPSDYDTIYTTLCSALDRSKATRCKSCIVTFDQPLFWKAHDIVSNADPSSELSSIIVRLGGFHILLSFLGAIGYIMSGSGLEDLLKIIYAENSVDKILSGHAYSRAVRAHFLVHASLAKRIMETIDFQDIEREEVERLLLTSDRTVVLTAGENDAVKEVVRKFEAAVNRTEQNGPTAKLWVQYFRMVTLVKHFIEAERSGDWDLHLNAIRGMLPFFHASGHFLYAKSAHLYLQNMENVPGKMPADEFEKFTTQGYFTIRRSNKFWSGIMSDQTIEQTLNRESKIHGGMFKRGADESVAVRWTMSAVHMQNICQQIEDFCDVHGGTTEQHVDFRPSRVRRDNSDMEKIDHWFDDHNPFPTDSQIMSISSGIIGTENINCHLASEIGTKLLNNLVGTNYDSVKFKRKDKVSPLSAVGSSITIDKTSVPINPLLLFQRISISKQTNEDLKDCFGYELAPYPLSLFNEEGMRKGTKSTLYNAFEPLQRSAVMGEKRLDVVDGGFLLHKVVWPRSNATFNTICDNDVSYVKRHFEKNVVIVFDGYPEDLQTVVLKGWERRRRAAKHRSPEVIVNATAFPPTTQEKFLSNDKNKARLIDILKKALQDSGVVVQQAPADADSFIVGTAIQEASNHDEVTIIGEDIDLLVILTALGYHLNNVFFKKPGRGRTPEQLYSPASFKYEESVAKHILFLHACSGCDTTSSIFNVGKLKFIETLKKNNNLNKALSLFREANIHKHCLAQAGECFLIALFGGDENVKTLDDLRFKNFTKSVTRNKFNFATLPPTSAAAEQHIYRTYLQVQMWMEYEVNATEWGWRKTNRGLEPIATMADPAPEFLLKTISCKCKTTCGKMCGCRKSGLKCSVLCHNCNGETCENVVSIRELLDEDDLGSDENRSEQVTPEPPELPDEFVDNYEEESNDENLAEPSAKRSKQTSLTFR